MASGALFWAVLLVVSRGPRRFRQPFVLFVLLVSGSRIGTRPGSRCSSRSSTTRATPPAR